MAEDHNFHKDMGEYEHRETPIGLWTVALELVMMDSSYWFAKADIANSFKWELVWCLRTKNMFDQRGLQTEAKSLHDLDPKL